MMLTITEEKDICESFSILKAGHPDAITFDSLKEILSKMGEKISDEDIRNMIE
jgi:Ca2+-binding EF-hand superfamily protein